MFFDAANKRYHIRLGKITAKDADSIRIKVESILNAKAFKMPLPPDVSKWLTEISDDFYAKLAQTGIIDPKKSTTLEDFISTYIESRTDNSEDTKVNKRQAAKTLYHYFGKHRDPESISEEEAKAYTDWLSKHKMGKNKMIPSSSVSPSSIWKRMQHVNEFFRAMLSAKFVTKNPFASIKQRPEYDETRKFYIAAEDIHKVMEYAPDAEWRLIIALWRFGGLRSTSEVLRLKWEHILWDQGKIVVPSSKTSHHGKSMRVIPIPSSTVAVNFSLFFRVAGKKSSLHRC